MMNNLKMVVSWVLVIFLLGLANGQLKDGDVRITNKGNTNTNAGVVEVYFNGEWGLVCADQYWNFEAASVVCRQAGFPTAIDVVSPYEYYDPILDPLQKTWLKDVYCNGDEKTLAGCVEYKPTASVTCPGNGGNIAAVLCPDARLVDTSNEGYTGRVEVFNEGQWYGICGEGRFWSDKEAKVVCEMLFPWDSYNVQSSTVAYTSPDKAVRAIICGGGGDEGLLHDCRTHFDSMADCDTRAAVSCVGDNKKEMDLKDDLKIRAVQLLLQLLKAKK